MSEQTGDASAEAIEASATMTDMIDDQPAYQLSNVDKLFKHAIAHFLVGISAFALWAAADTWYLVTELAIANFLSIATAIVAGVVVSTLVHEWFHYAGAKFSGASYKIPEKVGLFVYDFDFRKSTEAQFNTMSYAGQVGSWVAVIGLFLLVPIDNSGRAMLVAAAIGSAVFGAAIEWPVLQRTRESHDPLEELKKITPDVFKRCLFIGLGSGTVVWLVIS
ncbi:MAG: hypothetical protein V7754_06905 [Halioglobus sp.]